MFLAPSPSNCHTPGNTWITVKGSIITVLLLSLFQLQVARKRSCKNEELQVAKKRSCKHEGLPVARKRSCKSEAEDDRIPVKVLKRSGPRTHGPLLRWEILSKPPKPCESRWFGCLAIQRSHIPRTIGGWLIKTKVSWYNCIRWGVTGCLGSLKISPCEERRSKETQNLKCEDRKIWKFPSFEYWRFGHWAN